MEAEIEALELRTSGALLFGVLIFLTSDVGQRTIALTYAWHARSAISPWSPSPVMARIR
jgi:energy-converting hydrogenase Eha subunit H